MILDARVRRHRLRPYRSAPRDLWPCTGGPKFYTGSVWRTTLIYVTIRTSRPCAGVWVRVCGCVRASRGGNRNYRGVEGCERCWGRKRHSRRRPSVAMGQRGRACVSMCVRAWVGIHSRQFLPACCGSRSTFSLHCITPNSVVFPEPLTPLNLLSSWRHDFLTAAEARSRQTFYPSPAQTGVRAHALTHTRTPVRGATQPRALGEGGRVSTGQSCGTDPNHHREKAYFIKRMRLKRPRGAVGQ